jgi:hypothetical protein
VSKLDRLTRSARDAYKLMERAHGEGWNLTAAVLTVCHAYEEIRGMRAVIARLTIGSAMLIPAATPSTAMTTPRETNPSTRA